MRDCPSNDPTLAFCAECGAVLPAGEQCQANFHALLVLEGQVAGAPGSILHFYTVACYVLQHPDSMNFTAAALRGLRASLVDALDGRVTVEDLRRRARYAADRPTRVTCRAGNPPIHWRRGGWRTTVADILSAAPECYADRVLHWARTSRETLASDER